MRRSVISIRKMEEIKTEDVILFRMTYRDPTPEEVISNNSSDRIPVFITALGQLRFFSRKIFFTSLDNSIRNLQLAKNPGEVYRDTVWFNIEPDTDINDPEFEKKALSAMLKNKEERLANIKLSENMLLETIDFLRSRYNE